MKKYVWILALLLIPALCEAGRDMIWDKEGDDLLINKNGGISTQSAEDTSNLESISHERTTNGITLYLNGNDGETVDAVGLYCVGNGTVSATTFRVWADSMSVTVVGGLYPGTTWWLFSEGHIDTVAELITFQNDISTSAAGYESIITLSSGAYIYGKIASNLLTATSVETNILGAANTATLTATPAASPTATYEIWASSIGLITANGLYPGTTWLVLTEEHIDTQLELIRHINNMALDTPGFDSGGLAVRIQGSYSGNTTANLTEVTTATNCKGSDNAATLKYDSILGMSYFLPASGLATGENYYIKQACVNATYASGTTTFIVYSGTTTTTILDYETLPFSALDVKADCVPIIGATDTALRIDVVGSAVISAGRINLVVGIDKD